ncbi:MAG: hypothetical protein ACLQU2_14310 [Candidatus Binataceae bacterium]
MNDSDYRSTLECLRIAARLIMPLDLDGFLERVAALEAREAEGESLSVRRLARIAEVMRDEGIAERNRASCIRPAPPSLAAK